LPASQRRRFYAVLILFLATALRGEVARAAAVLSSFTATPESGQVRLDWVTSLEEELSHFYVRRGATNNQDYDDWDLIPIIEVGGSGLQLEVDARGSGSAYHFFDPNVPDGAFYCYALEAEDEDGSKDYFPSQPVCVTGGLPTATPTPTFTPTLSGSTTPGVTPTPSQTLTVSPSPPSGTPAGTITPTASAPTVPASATAPTAAAGTITPLPTFLPTLTPTRTRTPTPSQTSTVTLTAGPLLDSTLQPGTPPPGVAGLGNGSDLTLRTLILRVIALISVVGGLVFAGIYFLIVRRDGQGEGS
jgi:hypothetical protein